MMTLLGCYNGNENDLSCFYLTASETNGFIHGYDGNTIGDRKVTSREK